MAYDGYVCAACAETAPLNAPPPEKGCALEPSGLHYWTLVSRNRTDPRPGNVDGLDQAR